ncbi:MAG: phosphoribosylformylglycinamidine cyclo-ligase [Nitrospirae bacterium CG_4_10_14_0_8_um_filter_41_23]|nr:phosphoribosylformylglycinamidine cyclo-ligase [Nitrospirota bacterium]OIP61562.1 MAG: phosphoribosylformylglycinamidine cyclo-ligase [Nitrospirae bacterium CG2_30_41_42]PIQ93982.1 MAG: phosphoribosylformylglycinamidine cyclo-ligase [Nitrospirae bacterium CG11_big_fil_rev_8_21_14_0_20_41_14]PIV42309.1 MAG: phosphoribosylformylglycinamidine cyclo-ligase [Nitrospirae bacterium CG02_land_8_20_14_3_00_41_53]PIW86791.1 MAG: phosphoribosylformylglycinamidine cyclo-ligase [Nitrospirae bacterium CG_
MSKLTYKKAGVNIDEGDRFVRLISPIVKKTFRPEVMTEIGSFSALFKLDITKYKEPVLVSGTDGVGTKLKIAFMMDRHNTVGIDLVAMCVNDILTSGAEPLFFLDYFATGKLKPEKASEVIEGIVNGCKEAGCSLIGGETAEMPGFYSADEYDLSGFAVGVVDKQKIINGSRIEEGDVIIGIASNGLHSNGYSLVRRLFFDFKKMDVNTYIPDLGTTLGEELLRPTKIYVKAFMNLRNNIDIKGMAHITGGGIPGNLPRILPEGTFANIRINSWPVPKIFSLIKNIGDIPEEEMKKTFNMGLGYLMVVSKDTTGYTVSLLKKSGYNAFIIGNIEKGGRGVEYSQDKSII